MSSDAASGREDAALHRLRRTHVGRLLFEASRHFEHESLRRLRERGHESLTAGQKQALVHLPLAGARLTALADRAGMTKQAMMKLVDGLEAAGYVERVSDPRDGRAKLVQLTDEGLDLLRDGLDVVREIEAEYASVLGRGDLAAVKASLQALLAGLGATMPDDATHGDDGT